MVIFVGGYRLVLTHTPTKTPAKVIDVEARTVLNEDFIDDSG